ncbi:MAG: hypothetical protein DSY53_00125 [Persephonella sp.]|nr:MAG: hypothetical protein DSY53_00125 [Persephonella sp.]
MVRIKFFYLAKYLLVIFLFSIFFNSCSTKKESVKVLTENQCSYLIEKIKKIKPDNNSYKITGTIKGRGLLYALFKGYLKKDIKISFYSPFGEKLYTLESTGEADLKTYKNKNDLKSTSNDIYCIKSEKELLCANRKDFYKALFNIDIPFSLREVILGRYDLSNFKNYRCEGDKVIVEGDKQKYIFSADGKLERVNIGEYSIKYKWEDDKKYPYLIKIYKDDEYMVKIRIKSVKKVD